MADRDPAADERRGALTPVTEFLQTETASGIVLLAAAIGALVWANVSPTGYDDFWTQHLNVVIDESLQHWINDALMAVFFFVVGLEIKRELVVGELRDPRTAALPAIAALGGMVVPALVYLAWNFGGDGRDGWGIPMATDIAFAVGVLSLLSKRVPSTLRLFLLTLAIVDDVGAILVIAVVYTDDLAVGWLVGAAAALVVMLGLRALRVGSAAAYVLPAVALWYALYKSGVHATIAGVIVGLLTPARGVGGAAGPAEQWEHRLHPFSSFIVIPLFALANAGVQVDGTALREAAGSPVSWGVVTGLVVGKIVGISAAAAFAVRFRLGVLPAGLGWRTLGGAAALAGIGFTVSLFVSELAFGGDPDVLANAKLGVLVASLVSGALGTAILLRARSGADD
jgi:Na+:H+ antiporter, NhaA family